MSSIDPDRHGVGSAPAVLDARRIAAYRILRELGRGGMGTVYLAVRTDDESEKQVALKALELVRSRLR